MLYKVFDFADKEAKDVMVPRPEVVALSIDLPPEECLEAVMDSPFTRYPVYRETLDNVVGILHVRDLFARATRPRHARGDDRGHHQAGAHRPGDEGPRGAAGRVPARRTSTWRSSSTNTATWRGSSRSRICSRRSSATSRTSSTCRTSRSSRSTRTPSHRRHLPDRRLQRAVPHRPARRGLPHSRGLRLRPARASARGRRRRSPTTVCASTCSRSKGRGSTSSPSRSSSGASREAATPSSGTALEAELFDADN